MARETPYVSTGLTVGASATYLSEAVNVSCASAVTVVLQGDTSTDVDIEIQESMDGTTFYPFDITNYSETASDWSGDGLTTGSKIQYRYTLIGTMANSAAQRVQSPIAPYVRVKVVNGSGLANITNFAVAILAVE